MLFFGKKRKKEQEIDEAFAKVYQEIETIDNWNDPKKLEHYILDSCEQIIALTKEIEGEKTEYRIVTYRQLKVCRRRCANLSVKLQQISNS